MKKKLIRDNIPKIIEKSTGKKPETRILNQTEYQTALDNKLKEEVGEYLSSGKVEELADIQEVIFAILKTKKVKRSKFEKLRTKKAKRNGRFNKRIMLKTT